MVRSEARLRRGHNDQSCRGHQYSETTLTGESRFHISTSLWIEPGSLMTGSKRVHHWTSGTVCECSEIAGSPHYSNYFLGVFIFCSIILYGTVTFLWHAANVLVVGGGGALPKRPRPLRLLVAREPWLDLSRVAATSFRGRAAETPPPSWCVAG
jgi:hypothetical protein